MNNKRENTAVTEQKKEIEYSDYNSEEEEIEPYEFTYRDGTAQNECWESDR